VRAALDAFREAPGGGRRWVILGDMLELGSLTEAAHREVGAWVAGLPVAGLATVGTAMRLTAEAARTAGCPDVATFASPEGAAEHVLARLARGDRVLVKGSRGMRMERAVDALLGRLAPSTEPPRC
jgi:UDP-N-acetylmuramoyl-tripeptide--D-alanyl-D-alanine ligase